MDIEDKKRYIKLLIKLIIKSIIIIAHVDHGKTTLAFALSGVFGDTNTLEAQKGITILSKCITIKIGDKILNILDTPGHEAFFSEVRKAVQLSKGALLVVDSIEGVMPQTRKVIEEALNNKLKFILLVNKVDREFSNPEQTAMQVLNYLIEQGYEHEDIPIFYGSGLYNVFEEDLELAQAKIKKLKEETQLLKGQELANYVQIHGNNKNLLNKILEYLPEETLGDPNDDFKMMVSFIMDSGFYNKLLVGKIYSGEVKQGDVLFCFDKDGNKRQSFKAKSIFCFEKNGIKETNSLSVGEIGAIWGCDDGNVNDVISSVDKFPNIFQPIIPDKPRISVSFLPYKSLGKKDEINCDFGEVKKYLEKEQAINPGLFFDFKAGEVEVSGASELQIAILVYEMVKKDLAFVLSPTKITLKKIDNKLYEPVEKVEIYIPSDKSNYVNTIFETMNFIKAKNEVYETKENGIYLVFNVKSKDFLRIKYIIKAKTGSEVIFFQSYLFDEIFEESIKFNELNWIISCDEGTVTNVGALAAKKHGVLFVEEGDMVYKNQIVGLANKNNDVFLNVARVEELTNVRCPNKEIKQKAQGTKNISLEQMFTLNQIIFCSKENIEDSGSFRMILENNKKKEEGSIYKIEVF